MDVVVTVRRGSLVEIDELIEGSSFQPVDKYGDRGMLRFSLSLGCIVIFGSIM